MGNNENRYTKKKYFDKSYMGDSNMLLPSLEEFNENIFKYLEDISGDSIEIIREKNNANYNIDVINSMCSDDYKNMIEIKKQRLNKFNLKYIRKLNFLKENSKSKKDDKEKVNLNISKAKFKSMVTVTKGAALSEEYQICNEELYKNNSKVSAKYYIEYHNNADCGAISGFNIGGMKYSKGNAFWKNMIIAILLCLFIIGIVLKMEQINDYNMNFAYVILALALAFVLVKFFPIKRIISKRSKKIVKSINDKKSDKVSMKVFNLLRDNPLLQMDDFLMNLDYKVKSIHFAEDENELENLHIKVDLWDILQKYRNVIDCNTMKYNVVNYINGRDKYILSILFKLEITEIEYNSDIDYAKKHRNDRSCTINKKIENILVKSEIKKDDKEDFNLIITGYKIV